MRRYAREDTNLDKSYLIPPRGLEPLGYNSQTLTNTTLTENNASDLSTNLDISLQKHPELQQIINIWPELPQDTKKAIISLVESYEILQKEKRESDKLVVYNMGYQSKNLKNLLDIIQEYGITLLVDIRSIPYSRKDKNFNKNRLEYLLPCKYKWRGVTLGGKGDNTITDWQEGLKEIASLAKTEKILLMCFEDDINDCHRKVLAEILSLHHNIHNINL